MPYKPLADGRNVVPCGLGSAVGCAGRGSAADLVPQWLVTLVVLSGVCAVSVVACTFTGCVVCTTHPPPLLFYSPTGRLSCPPLSSEPIKPLPSHAALGPFTHTHTHDMPFCTFCSTETHGGSNGHFLRRYLYPYLLLGSERRLSDIPYPYPHPVVGVRVPLSTLQ